MKVFAITGWSGTGKTTLIEKLIAHFVGEGLRVATLKHAHAGFDMDTPLKDSYRMRAAGARQVLVSAPHRWALLTELREAAEPTLLAHLQRLSGVDLVLVEGWKYSALPKLETHRAAANKPLRYPEEARIIGVASDVAQICLRPDVLFFDLNDVLAIAAFVRQHAITLAQCAALENAELVAENNAAQAPMNPPQT